MYDVEMNFIRNRGAVDKSAKIKTFGREGIPTQCDNDGDDYRRPERNVPEQDHDLVVEVVALEERIDDNPEQHND